MCSLTALALLSFPLFLVCHFKATQASELHVSVENAGERLSIRLCCPLNALYNESTHQCQTIADGIPLTVWEVSNFWSDGNETKVNLLHDLSFGVEMVQCSTPFYFKFFEYSNDSEHCYTPYYHKELEKYIVATVDCDRVDEYYNFIFDSYIYGIGFSTIVLILTFLIHAFSKYEQHITSPAVCYLVAWILAHTLAMLALRFRCTEMVFYVWFFFIVTRWCLLFHGLTTLSTNFSFSSARFLIIGGAVVTGLSSWILSDRFPLGTWPSRMVIVLVLAIACCIFAHSLYQLRGHMKVLCKSFFKSFYLIILPWIMLLLWPVNYRNIPLTVTFYIYLIMEGPLIFWFFDGCDKLCGKQSSQSSPDAHPVEGYCTTQEELYSQGSTI